MNNNQLSHPISTATPSHLQYQQQPTLPSNINNIIGGERGLLLILEVRGERGLLLILEGRVGCS
jgi:hypothetical protein